MAVDSISGVSAVTYIQQQFAGQAQQANINPYASTAESDQATGGVSQGQSASRFSDQVQLKGGTATKNLETARAIEQLHARLNEQAKGVRETNEALAQAALKTDQMRTTLQAITKNFPPFPVGDNQRQEILMSYISLKKEIEQLMIPPPPAPLYENVNKMWDSLFGQNGQMLSSAVPALEKDSSDKKVKDAAIRLDSTGEQLAALSTGLTDALIQGR